MATKPILHTVAHTRQSESAQYRALASSAGLSNLLSRTATKKLFFVVGDLVTFVSSHHLAEALVQRRMHLPSGFLNPGDYYFFYAPFFMALLYVLQGYTSPDLRRPEKELELVAKAVSIAFVALACANFVLFKSQGFSRYLLFVWYALALLLLLVSRFAIRALYGSLWRRGFARQKALLLGSPDRFAAFERRLAIQRYRGYELAGALIEPNARSIARPTTITLPILGSIDDWQTIARAQNVHLIVVHFVETSAQDYSRILEIVRACREMGIEVEVHSHLFGPTDLHFERDDFSGCFRLKSQPRWSCATQRLAKAFLDLAIGLAGSLVTLALIPFVALIIKLEDGGPIFHRREYVGTDGRVHHFLKFRTMVEDAEKILESDLQLKAQFESTFKLRNDPRILRCGRFLRKYSLDEFPQFFSILARQITFVGPRAITPAAHERYGDLAPKLLSMKPGLTGFWQVMGRQTTTFEEKVQMDMFYIDHWSIWLDLVILAKTFWEVLRAKGAY